MMRDTTILSDKGYLGPHSPVLKVGDTQSLIFKAEDCGPWYLTPDKKDWQRHNRSTGKRKRVEQSKKMLVAALAAAGVVPQSQRNHTKKGLIKFATSNGIDPHIIPGWQGQPKGLMQVLLEQQYTTLDGRKKSRHRQGQLTIITLPRPCQLQRLQG